MIADLYGQYSTREYLSRIRKSPKPSLMVLTSKERDLILEELLNFDLDVAVFERKYPIFPHIRYTSNPRKNLRELNSLIGEIRNLGILGRSIAHHFATRNQFKIERKIRHKNRLDRFFAFGYQGGYQEVFKLREERNHRIIVAFDFNSMFPSCMAGDFARPGSIKYERREFQYDGTKRLASGMYRVILKNAKDDFFMEHHPFRYARHGNRRTFCIEAGQEIELLLFKNEIENYSRYFSETVILESLSSTTTIKHPLYKDATTLYEKRRKASNSPSSWKASFYKLWLVTLHSASNPKSSETRSFSCADRLKQYLSRSFMLNIAGKMESQHALDLINDQKNFLIKKTRNGYQVTHPRLSNSEAVFSLSAQVLANSRVKMMETMRRFIDHPTVELCYANIDSLHVSVDRDELENFLSANQAMISDKMGDLKIQCIADKGYWFDIGRYWLFKNGEVVQHKNIMFNHRASRRNFIRHRELKSVCKEGIFSYVKSVHRAIENSFSYGKHLSRHRGVDFANFSRYRYHEIESLTVAGETYEQEIVDSKACKVDLFNRIATD